MKKLVIGSGPGWKEAKQRYADQGIEAISIDIIKEFEPDIVTNIENGLPINKRNGAYPKGLYGEKFDEVEIHHVLEHIETNKGFKQIMTDIHSLLNEGGTVDICVPHYQCPSAVECYEHVRFFSENSFMNFYDNPYAKEMGLPMFERVINEVRLHGTGSKEVHVILKKPLCV